jgi:hypothetical protein
VSSFFTKLKLDGNPSHQQSCSELGEGRAPTETQQLTSVSDHLADAEYRPKFTLVLGALALLKYPGILTSAAEESINLSHRNTNQIICRNQARVIFRI